MSECPPSGAVQDSAGQRAAGLTPERIDAILADFRAWLTQAATSPEPAPPPHEQPLDLHTLLGQFTALRHEVHLQTKAHRAQQELAAETLRQYGLTLEQLGAARTADGTDTDALEEDVLRPFLKHLVDARDALALARVQVGRVGEALQPTLKHLATLAEPNHRLDSVTSGEPPPSRGFFQRLFGRSNARPTPTPAAALQWHLQDLEAQNQRLREAAEAAGRVQAAFDSILTGYTMSVQRLDRTLDACGLEPIPCLGEPFDPELMEVVEVTADAGRSADEVVEVIRPGYLWRGRVFRYAQVRVAKP